MTDIIPQLPFPISFNTAIQHYWQSLNEGVFVSTQCTICHTIHFPPRTMCPSCYSSTIKWITLPPTGKILSYTYVNIPPAGFRSPYYLIIVQMDVLNKPIAGIYIGSTIPEIQQEVRISFQQIGKQAFIHFQ